MSSSPLAGSPASAEPLIDPTRLEQEYYACRPDVDDTEQLVSFGTSGHKGSTGRGTFTEWHVLALAQAVCDYRKGKGITGPVYMGKDAQRLSAPAHRTALEVFAANGVRTVIQREDGVTPTPVISRAILTHNRGGVDHLADGIVVASFHNQPEDGGFKYVPPNGGPSDTDVAKWIEERANEYLLRDTAGVRRVPFEAALKAATTRQDDFARPYVDDLRNVIDTEAIRGTVLRFEADPLGGAARSYWQPINEAYGLRVDVTSPAIAPRSPPQTTCQARAGGEGLLEPLHGSGVQVLGSMDPSHFLAVAIDYLLAHRPRWPGRAAVGKTMTCSEMIDRVVRRFGRALYEVPAGFKWFTPVLFDGSCCIGGDDRAGASFLRHDGAVWTTERDDLLMALLAAEITARTGKDPGEHYRELVDEFGAHFSIRIDVPATPREKARLRKLSPEDVVESTLGGETITGKMTRAPGNNAPLDGLKMFTVSGWIAVRASGTDDVCRVYAESLKDQGHLDALVGEAQKILADTLAIDVKSSHVRRDSWLSDLPRCQAAGDE